MITRIELTNFMSHEHSVIEPAAGLTVLIGPNNCGKSAIVAALQILCSNENSTYVMRHGAKEVSVKVETDDGHTIEWKRKSSPSYLIDGQKFDRLRGSGLPDELHAALRLPKVEAGDDNDFDIHFGAQKSPIFLLQPPASNAARFFASSSDAIRLVEMQKRHKDKLADAVREKNRLEAEAKKVNAALETLEPVVTIEHRLAAARDIYDELRRLEVSIAAARTAEAGLRTHFASVDRFASQVNVLRDLPRPPAIVAVEPLEFLIDAIISASRRLRFTAAQASAMKLLPAPPGLPPIAPLENLIETIQAVNARRQSFGGQSKVMSELRVPPELCDIDAIDHLITNTVRFANKKRHAAVQRNALSPTCPPPLLADSDPLKRHIERLAEADYKLTVRRGASRHLNVLREPPLLANESEMAASLAALHRARRQVNQWHARATTFAAVEAAPRLSETSAIDALLCRLDEGEKKYRERSLAAQSASADLTSAAAELRSNVEGRACPICGSALDAESVIARATIGLGVHAHG